MLFVRFASRKNPCAISFIRYYRELAEQAGNHNLGGADGRRAKLDKEISTRQEGGTAQRIERPTYNGGIIREILGAHLETYFTVFPDRGLKAVIQP